MSQRLHPYELVFAAPRFEDEAFPKITEDAEVHGVDVRDRDRFLLLAQVGELLRMMLPPDATTPAYTQFSAVLAQAYHFWRAGKPTFTIGDDELRKLLSPETTVGVWDMAPPAPAGYVQLPRNVLFAKIDEHGQAEAVDGFFFTMPGVNDPAVPPYERLDVVLVLGLLPGRDGFSIIDVGTEVPAQESGHFGDAVARETGSDFENVLPGGEGRLFAVTNVLEVLKLVSRCFWWVVTVRALQS